MSDIEGYSDATRVDLPVIRTRRARLQPAGPSPIAPTPRALRPVTHHVDPGNTMGSASLAEVLRRETIVRRNRVLLEPLEPPPNRPPISPSWLSIDWVRGTDRKQRIRVVGGDGFEILGVGEGLTANGATSMLGVGLEGRVHRVEVRPGAGPQDTLRRLAEGLARYYQLEIIEVSAQTVLARVLDHRRCHT